MSAFATLAAEIAEYPLPQLAQEFDHVFDNKDGQAIDFLKWFRIMALFRAHNDDWKEGMAWSVECNILELQIEEAEEPDAGLEAQLAHCKALFDAYDNRCLEFENLPWSCGISNARARVTQHMAEWTELHGGEDETEEDGIIQ